ncbi:MAG: hypothetical protein ABR562_01180 [Thermoplasmatota archaeon]
MAVALVAAVLILNPVLAETTPVRLVSVGTGDIPVEWSVDGMPVAVGADGVPVTVEVAAGPHTLTARAEFAGAWEVMARPQPTSAGMAYVPAWTAATTGTPQPPEPVPAPAFGAVAILMVGVAGMARRRCL